MNTRNRNIEKLHIKDTLPNYNNHKKHWQVIIDGRKEFGPLEYVASEFIKDGLYFPFNLGNNIENWEDHAHSFEDVIRYLIDNPYKFSIDGYEEYYSKQEIEFLHKLKDKLLSF